MRYGALTAMAVTCVLFLWLSFRRGHTFLCSGNNSTVWAFFDPPNIQNIFVVAVVTSGTVAPEPLLLSSFSLNYCIDSCPSNLHLFGDCCRSNSLAP